MNRNKIITLARSNLNSIESMISKTPIDSEISHAKYATIINEEYKYCRLKESVRMIKNQRSDVERDELIGEGEGKRIGINKTIRENNNNI